jgi:hypothetical protein
MLLLLLYQLPLNLDISHCHQIGPGSNFCHHCKLSGLVVGRRKERGLVYEIKDKLDTRAMKIEALSSPGPERKWLVADSGVTRLPSTTLSSAVRSLYGEHHGH